MDSACLPWNVVEKLHTFPPSHLAKHPKYRGSHLYRLHPPRPPSGRLVLPTGNQWLTGSGPGSGTKAGHGKAGPFIEKTETHRTTRRAELVYWILLADLRCLVMLILKRNDKVEATAPLEMQFDGDGQTWLLMQRMKHSQTTKSQCYLFLPLFLKQYIIVLVWFPRCSYQDSSRGLRHLDVIQSYMIDVIYMYIYMHTWLWWNMNIVLKCIHTMIDYLRHLYI